MTILETFIKLRDDLKTWVTNNLNQKANISYVDEKFAAVPEFDPTEIQDAIDANATAIDTKVDKVEGKGLSTNDYTTAEKDKLSTVEANANFYKHPNHTSRGSGLYKVAVDSEGHVSDATLASKEDIVALGIPAQDTVYDDSNLKNRIESAENNIVDINEALDNASRQFEGYKTTNDYAVAENATNIGINRDEIKAIKDDYLTSAHEEQLQDSIKQVSDKATENTKAIEKLNGEGEGSVKQSINDAFNEFATNVTNDDVVNTYIELINYAAEHGPEFTSLVGVVDGIDKHVGEVETDLSEYKEEVSEQFEEVDSTINSHVDNRENPHGVNKEQIGLANVDNTSDAEKPISNATQVALDAIQEDLNKKADSEHAHSNLYYDKGEIDELVTVDDIDVICGHDSGEDISVVNYATEQWVRGNYQPKGNYATESYVDSKIAEIPVPDDSTEGAVLYTEQTLTEEQKAQVRENIGIYVVEPAEDDIPKVFFGNPLPQTKTDTIMSFRYISKTEDISGYCKTKAQGNSSMSYPKKNQTVKLYKDANCTEKLKVDFKGWGKQNKFCFKANWIDLTHARNIVSARLWGDVVKSRANYTEVPELLRTSPNQGAIDGFPVKVYAGGVYQGRYTINIPKDAWMANMDDELDTHCILCGENYGSGCFRAAANINGGDWTDEIHDTVPASIKARWNEVISFVMNSTDEEFKANLGNYFNVPSLIDYHLFGLLSCGLDAYGKNQLYMTYDGQKWFASMYDMDSTWGLWWTGESFVGHDYSRSEYQDFKDGQGNLLYIRLEQLFEEELQARWEELKNGALSIENIINRFERFTDITPADLVSEDYASTTEKGAYTSIPGKTTNNIRQIRSFALARMEWMDGKSSDLVYSLAEPTTFNSDAGDKIDTGVMLFDTNKDFTVIVDFQSDENIDSYYGNRPIVHSSYESSPWPGFNLAKKADGGVLFGSTVFVDASEGLNRQLVVITKDAENAEIKARTATKEANITGSLATTTFEQTAVIGALKTTDGIYASYWKGTVYRCDIYLRKFTDDEVDAVLGSSIPCTGIALDQTELTFNGVDTQTITATITPSDTTDSVVWVSSDPNVAFITIEDNVCTVHGVNNGNAIITVTCGDQSASCEVSVEGIETIYKLPTVTTFNGVSDYIDTGVKLFDEDKDFTVYIRFKSGNNEGTYQPTTLHAILEDGNNYGFSIINDNVAAVTWANQFRKKSDGEIELVLTHKAGTNHVFINGTCGLFVNLASGTHDDTTLLGCYQTNNGDKGRFWNGTIYDCEIYNRVFTDEELIAKLTNNTEIVSVEWSDTAAYSVTKGAVVSGGNYVSEPIEIADNSVVIKMYNTNGATFSWFGFAQYDENMNFIRYIEGTNIQNIVSSIDDNTKYLRLSTYPNGNTITPANGIEVTIGSY